MLQGKWLRTITLATALGGMLTQQSCKKENGIDNNNVISTPYSLYYADNQGALFNTNDGILIKKIFNTDGKPQRSIITSGSNLLFIKDSVYLSTDNGRNFNPVYRRINQAARWQSVALDVPSHDRIYICSTDGYGVYYSENHGQSWQQDTLIDKDNIFSSLNPSSFAQLKSGDLFAFSNSDQKLYKRTARNDRWRIVASNGLPTGTYFLSRLNDALIASDRAGGGIYFSTDRGQSWTAYSGLPGIPIYATYAPFDQGLLVATGAGIYRLAGGSFVPSNNGIAAGATVFSITAKTDTYKNGLIKPYVYIATNKGLFRSEDGGLNWVFMDDGLNNPTNPDIKHDVRLVY